MRSDPKGIFSASCLFVLSVCPISDLKIFFKSETFDVLLLTVDEDGCESMKPFVVLYFGQVLLLYNLCLVYN